MKILKFLFFYLMVSTAMGQKVHFDTAPLNPKPLEYLSYVVPSTIKGDVAYYKGNFYDANRNLLLEDGTSFMKYAKWTKNEAYAAKSIFMKFNATGNLLEFVNYTNNSNITYLFEYDSKENLIKQQYQNDVTTYTYDSKGRLDTEFRKFASSTRTVSIKYSYKNEGNLLKINKKSTYVDGEEMEELHYKTGRIVYRKTVLGEEKECAPDARGNCVSEKDKKTNSIYKIYYNVIYRDELKPENITVRNIKKQSYGDNIPQIEIAERVIKLPITRVGADAVVYLPFSKSYVKALNFYDHNKIKIDIVVPTEKISNNKPYLALWHNDRNPVVLIDGKQNSWLSYADEHYSFFYDEKAETYYYVPKTIKGITGQLVHFNEIKSPIVMYIDSTKNLSITLIKGKKQFTNYGFSAKKINDTEMALLFNNTPQYIVPIVPIPENLKIYGGRNYNGEKMLD